MNEEKKIEKMSFLTYTVYLPRETICNVDTEIKNQKQNSHSIRKKMRLNKVH